MKTLKEVREIFPYEVRQTTYQLRSIERNFKLDFEVYLPSREKKLQRDYVWSQEQKEDLIWSFFLQRPIPPLAVINTASMDNVCLQIIDGKQRLMTMLDFIKNRFSVTIEGESYLFNELPIDWQNAVNHANIKANEILVEYGKDLSDDEKISWFKQLNFGGTQMDKKHLENLK